MLKQHRAALTICVLLGILIFHMVIAWQDIATLSRSDYLYDDSFYAFKIAQNIAAGRGITFDGVNSTTGFQPLYVFILVPAFMISGENMILPIHIALSLLALFTCFTAYFIYRISRLYVGWAASITAAAIWAFSPIVTRQSANGLETAIAAFMITACIFYYLSRLRNIKNPPRGRFFVLGILLGLAVLTRIDGTFLALVLLLDYLLLLRKRGEQLRTNLRLFLLPLGVLILYGPWLIFNLIETGSPLQDSGVATRFLSLAYAAYFGYGIENLSSSGPDASFLWDQVVHSASVMKVIPPVHVLFRSIEKLGIFLGSRGIFHLAGNIFGFLIFIGAGFTVRRWRNNKQKSRRSELHFLLLFSGLLLVSYSLYIFGAFFFLRYYYPIFLIASIYCAFFLQDAFDWYKRRSSLVRRASIFAVGVYVMLFISFSYSRAFKMQTVCPFYDIAEWVKENTLKDETIGVFQCGTIGYFSNRKIINLDGKVNRSALYALKNGSLIKYIKKEDIDVILDHSKIIKIFFGKSLDKMSEFYPRDLCGSLANSSGWIAYRRVPLEKNIALD